MKKYSLDVKHQSINQSNNQSINQSINQAINQSINGCEFIHPAQPTDGRPFQPKKLSVPFLYPGVPAG
jgi:delta-aminolevulinic acid dehydratase/porphobilinogen synthase